MASTTTTVSLRAAAKALGMPPTRLARLLESEPTWAAAVIQQPGLRRAMAIQLELLQAAWAGLQGGSTPEEQLSDRERLRRERQQRLYWQGQELKQQVLALEQQHVQAMDVAQARRGLHAHLRQRMESWLEEITPAMDGITPGEAYQQLSTSIQLLLSELARSPAASCKPEAAAETSDPQQSETQCRIQIEHYRARLHQLRAQIHSKELISAADVKAKAWTEARLFRDQLLAIPARSASLAGNPKLLRADVMACLPRH